MTRSGRSSAGSTTPTRPGSQQLTEQLNLDDSLITRYFDWLGGLLTGDLGTSIASQQPVSELISTNVVNTLVLVLLSAIVMIPVAFGIAMISANYRRRRPDTIIQTVHAGARRAAGVRHRHPAGRAVLDHGLPRPAGGHHHPAPAGTRGTSPSR